MLWEILLAAAQLAGIKVSKADLEREVRKIAARDVRRILKREQRKMRELHDLDFDDDDEEE